MQTNIIERFQQRPDAQEAEAILRSCVHCGFCTATCPTYQELNDERDGPRGRIYLIKQFLESGEVTEKTRKHLDRCLTCRSCETTCPSGVQYGRLADIGRHMIEETLERPLKEKMMRWGLRKVLPYPQRFGPLLKLGQTFRPLTPSALKAKIPPKQKSLAVAKKNTSTGLKKNTSTESTNSHARVMLVLGGCAQPSATPNTNAAATRVLAKLGITLIDAPKAGCCGAVSHHLSAHEEALGFIKRNIDAWWPAIEAGAEAIVVSASGCGAMIQDYGHLLKDDAEYATKAQRVTELAKDLSEVLLAEDLGQLNLKASQEKIAFHCPCTLQHALQLNGVVEQVLEKAGINLVATRDKHLCCGSAGTYSILQPELSQKLLANKLKALTAEKPERIVTANIGCQLHLGTRADIPVQHWIELLDNDH